MTDYSSITIVQPSFDPSVVTPFEHWLLSRMFSCDEHPFTRKTTYYAHDEVNTLIDTRSFGGENPFEEDDSELAQKFFYEYIAAGRPDYLDLCGFSYVDVFQSIIERSEGDVSYVTLESSIHAAKIVHDGFGGTAELITAVDHTWINTSIWLNEQISAARAAERI